MTCRRRHGAAAVAMAARTAGLTKRRPGPWWHGRLLPACLQMRHAHIPADAPRSTTLGNGRGGRASPSRCQLGSSWASLRCPVCRVSRPAMLPRPCCRCSPLPPTDQRRSPPPASARPRRRPPPKVSPAPPPYRQTCHRPVAAVGGVRATIGGRRGWRFAPRGSCRRRQPEMVGTLLSHSYHGSYRCRHHHHRLLHRVHRHHCLPRRYRCYHLHSLGHHRVASLACGRHEAQRHWWQRSWTTARTMAGGMSLLSDAAGYVHHPRHPCQ